MERKGKMIIRGVNLATKEPDEVLVRRQLASWLDPGWCVTASVGSESSANRKRKHMVWRIAGVTTLLVLFGLVTSYPMAGLNHSLVVLAIVFVLVCLVHERRTLVTAAKQNGGLTGSSPASLVDPEDLARFEGEGGLGAFDPTARSLSSH